MASASDVIFGTAPSATIKQNDVINADQQEALRQLLMTLQSPTPNVAVPVTTGQQQLIDSSVPLNTQAQSEVDTSTKTYRDLTTNPAGDFQQEVVDPLTWDFTNKILPQISRGFGNDFFSTERQKQDRFATEDLIRNLAEQKSKFLRDDRGVQLSAAGGIAQNAAGRGDILKQFLESAGVGRDIEQGNLLANEETRRALLQLLLGGATAPTKETVGVSNGGSSGLLQGLAQGAGAAVTKSLL